ncbi:glutamate synthase-related protein [Microaerobacter geothermalis]|uniref:glutamate synthase-related protein n=1 Tax=Microaerobacter geothermalis TaxID=674972 RepID=UPI001F21DC87|nr:glutamate synthase-related protein [Microaerobacter geothermalis]MCF6094406.1 glutamate synthase-related protein [Microaerobacter geothermalis]
MKKGNISRFKNLLSEEHDSCGIVAIIEKNNKPTHKNVLKTIDALIKMEHRSGFIDGEGDGCGILTDIPRSLWAQYLAQNNIPAELAYEKGFSVAHIFIPRSEDIPRVKEQIKNMFADANFSILLERTDEVNSSVLGKNGSSDEPSFWQIAAKCDNTNGKSTESHIFELHVAIEEKFNVHVASFSNHSVIYKVMGAANILPQYFNDVKRPEFQSAVTIGHNRYSTNTLSNFFRVQPFSLLGHNGEINTISKLQDEAAMLNVPLVEGGSDSQNLNRTIETFIHRYGMTLFEAMEMAFPPIINEMKNLRPELQDLYVYLRQTWGHFSQGPAGIVSRYSNECVFSVDALGLRPLWMLECDDSYYFSSEQGIISVYDMVSEPKPLAPGEKVGIILKENEVQVIHHSDLQNLVLQRVKEKVDFSGLGYHIQPPVEVEVDVQHDKIDVSNQMYSAFGWDREHIQLAEQMASNGAEPIHSLGYDGPLAALSNERQNIADFIKESVAVVTNPAIDRDREMEHFSTRAVLGNRPPLMEEISGSARRLELLSPILLEGTTGQQASKELNTLSYEQVLHFFQQNGNQIATLSTHFTDELPMKESLEKMAQDAIDAVENGATLLILEDTGVHRNGKYWIDPHLAVSKVDKALKAKGKGNGNLRRQTSILIRSGAIRNLHDIVIILGLGADIVSPYLLFATVEGKDGLRSVKNLFSALKKGMEKVISTIGIHELRGYSRLFSAIGLHQEIAEVLDIVNFCGSDQLSRDWKKLEEDSRLRHKDYQDEDSKPAKTFHLFPRIWKSIGQLAQGMISYHEYKEKLDEQEINNPISIRHLADINYEKRQKETAPLDLSKVNIGVGHHSLPFIISSMSFGSQNEIAFRAYAEAADQLNMISLNGEGGEIKDMLGKYPKTRGQQIASGRFGVNIELCNSTNLLEIKIGQGAKPGEGGHLPGSKVTEKIAAARNAVPGSDLISPSNNHDIYSIEDLAQIIYEMKTANREAKVAVKVPIVPNIGTISVGIAKAGADFINLSGFDGGTGAARTHAIQHVGLPVEIGVKAAHNALIEAGLRDKVEIWADGGVKSSLDVMKLILLGANRVGFGTLSMIAVGCTTCRGCHLDTCHVGIATQIDSIEEAKEKGLRRFVPRQFEQAVENLKTLFTAFGEELRQITANLGFENTQDLVGRSDLLHQVRGLDQLDLSALLEAKPYEPVNLVWADKKDTASSAVLVAAGAEQSNQSGPVYYSTERPITHTFSNVLGDQRVLASDYSGARVKPRLDGSYRQLPSVHLHFENGSVPGNGLAAYHADGIHVRVTGGAQDGVGKTGFGGRVSVMKAINKNQQFIDGSVGKGFCYGAQKGLYIVQGNADARAGIRLSGASVVIGGEITSPINDSLGGIGARANIKGFAFEYMTNGRAVVLGDPGPWICAGMTGGVVYLRYQPKLGLDEAAIKRRIAKGAKVAVRPLSEKGVADIQELLTAYIEELKETHQYETADRIQQLLDEPEKHFLEIIPTKEQADPSISTE